MAYLQKAEILGVHVLKSIIVTGATGFIGRHCIKHLLEANYHVHAIYHSQPPAPNSATSGVITWHQCDLLDEAATAELIEKIAAEFFLHFAWYAEPGKFWTSSLNDEWLRASLHLLRSFHAAGGKRFVGAGSCAEYEWSHPVLNELTTPQIPETLYGVRKNEFFQEAARLSESLGFDFAWGRIFWLYGPGEDKRRLVPYVINSLLSNEKANCSAGIQQRDFLYVDDVALAFAGLVDSTVRGPINIGSGEAVAVKSIIEKIACILDKEDLVQLGALATPENEPPCIVADTNRLANELGFSPRFSLDQGLMQTLHWWKNLRANEQNTCTGAKQTSN